MIVASFLPELEPMLGAALATNTAYLSFARFRYRTKIREQARKQLSDLEVNGTISAETRRTELYQRIDRLARLEDHDEDDPAPKAKTKMPPGWAFFYTHLFEHHRDRVFCGCLVGLTAIMLVLGVAQRVDLVPWSNPFFAREWIWITFLLALTAIAAPLLLMLLGKKVVRAVSLYCQTRPRTCWKL